MGAECYVRSAATQKLVNQIERVADLEKDVSPVNKNQSVCRVSFRAFIAGRWHNAMGEELFNNNESMDQACARAIMVTKVSILESVGGSRLNINQEMICSDKPSPKDRNKVGVGDRVRESEVTPHPLHREEFGFRGSRCRWFIESSPLEKSVKMEQGIICHSPPTHHWVVVDKW